MRVQEGFGATVGEPVDASITIGDVTLSRTARGWSMYTRGAVDLAQLDAAVQLAKQVPALQGKAESALTIVGEDGDGDAVADARELLQAQAETPGEDAFTGPLSTADVEFGVGPVEYNDPIYSIHILSKTKLEEIVQSETLKFPIKMLEIGGEYVPDKTFSGNTVTTETYAEWHQHIWPVWKLHEDGFVELSQDGKTALITQRGQIVLKQIADGKPCVYGEDGGVYNPLRNAYPPQPDDSAVGLVDDGWGGTIPYEWVKASYDIRQVIAVGGDPKVVADGLWLVAQGLKLSAEDTEDFVYWACDQNPYRESLHHYDHVDDVMEDIEQRLKALPTAEAK